MSAALHRFEEVGGRCPADAGPRRPLEGASLLQRRPLLHLQLSVPSLPFFTCLSLSLCRVVTLLKGLLKGLPMRQSGPLPPVPCAHLLCPFLPCKPLAAASTAPLRSPAPLPSAPRRSHARSPLPAHLGTRPHPSHLILVCTVRRKKSSLSLKLDRTVADAVTNSRRALQVTLPSE